MKLGATKTDSAQGPTDEGTLTIFEARRDFSNYYIVIKELRITRAHILDIAYDGKVEFTLRADCLHR